jgi:hypothetical protein
MSSDSQGTTPPPGSVPAAGGVDFRQAPAAAEPPDTQAPTAGPPDSLHQRARYGLPRVLIIVVGLAAGVVVIAGLRAIPDIIGPVFLALVLTITVNKANPTVATMGWALVMGLAGAYSAGSSAGSGCRCDRSCTGTGSW